MANSFRCLYINLTNPVISNRHKIVFDSFQIPLALRFTAYPLFFINFSFFLFCLSSIPLPINGFFEISIRWCIHRSVLGDDYGSLLRKSLQTQLSCHHIHQQRRWDDQRCSASLFVPASDGSGTVQGQMLNQPYDQDDGGGLKGISTAYLVGIM